MPRCLEDKSSQQLNVMKGNRIKHIRTSLTILPQMGNGEWKTQTKGLQTTTRKWSTQQTYHLPGARRVRGFQFSLLSFTAGIRVSFVSLLPPFKKYYVCKATRASPLTSCPSLNDLQMKHWGYTASVHTCVQSSHQLKQPTWVSSIGTIYTQGNEILSEM